MRCLRELHSTCRSYKYYGWPHNGHLFVGTGQHSRVNAPLLSFIPSETECIEHSYCNNGTTKPFEERKGFGHCYLCMIIMFLFILTSIQNADCCPVSGCQHLSSSTGWCFRFTRWVFPFWIKSPSRTPPKVRRPPYAQADIDCPGNFYYFKNRIIIRIHGNLVVVRWLLKGTDAVVSGGNSVQSLDNLCGDLNKGKIIN